VGSGEIERYFWISIGKGYTKEEEREAVRNGLLLFPVSRLRIPKIPDFC
jgi:hypothetical protein